MVRPLRTLDTARLQSLLVLAHVVEAGSVTAAARRLACAKSTVSHHLAALERSVGASLFARAGRGLVPTMLGQALAAHGREIARAAGAAAAAAREAEAPVGTLRVAMPAGIADALVVPMLADFLATYPGIALHVTATDELTDLGAGGIDVAFRIGGVEDGRFVARRLHAGTDIIVAAPAYLAGAPPVATPGDLEAHPWIGFARFGGNPVFALEDEAGCVREVRASCRVLTTSGLQIRDWAIAGLGVARIPAFAVRAELAAGRLVQLLPRHVAGRPTLYAAYMPERFRPANVRRLIDHAVRHFAAGRARAR